MYNCQKNVNNEIFMGWNGGKVEVTTFSTIEREYHRKGKRWSRGTPSIPLVEVVGEERIVSTSFLSFLQVSSPLQLPTKWLVGDNYTIFSFFRYQYPPLSIYLLFILCIKSCGFFVTEYMYSYSMKIYCCIITMMTS